MSNNHDRRILNQAPVPGPRRTREHANGSGGRTFPAVREIHKNAWLKRSTAPEKKGSSFIKKYEKHWVVFCVHDDVEALLEFYTEPKMGATHKPNSVISLSTCLHVSPSIIGQDNEYEFVVTLPNQVIRLIAANWDQMIEWVESLQGKLREMNILSPKDNVYSRLPDISYSNPAVRPAPVTTRDPNSPLPPPPPVHPLASVPPVVEMVRPSQNSSRARENSSTESNPVDETPSGTPSGAKPRKTHRSGGRHTPQNHQNGHREAGVSASSASSSAVDRSAGPTHVGPNSSTTSIGMTEIVENLGPMEVSSQAEEEAESNDNNNVHITSSRPVVVVNGGASTSNTSVVQVTFSDNGSSSPINVISDASPTVSMAVLNTPASAQAASATALLPSPVVGSASNISQLSNSRDLDRDSSHRNSAPSEPQYAVPMKRSNSSENVYEHLFISPSFGKLAASARSTAAGAGTRNNGEASSSVVRSEEHDQDPPLIPRRRRHHHKNSSRSGGSSSFQRSSSLGRLDHEGNSRDIHECRTQNPPNNGLHQNSQRNGKGNGHSHAPNTTAFAGPISPQGRPTGSEFRPMEAMIGVRSGEYRIRRDDVPVVGPSGQLKTDLERTQSGPTLQGGHIPLKEQQVMRLKAEIQHPAGVRIVLRKKDCVNSIAFVDYLGGVWVAGWKQQQHPVLYYAFHVGDQIVRIAGVTVQTSAEAHRAIKMVSSMQVEFIIRRLPYGRVLVLKRGRDGEPLGIAIESNSAEIGEVVSGGLAAKQGLPPHAIAADGKSSCNWFLTEINNRPLSLLAKESEVRERLNAVGREISILVQPADLVKHLRKQLKSVKGFKDYLVV